MTTRVRDMWPVRVGPNVLAWAYRDDDPACETVYTVYVGHPGGRPRLQLEFEDGTHTSVSIERPERFGEWDTPRKFAEWARRWKEAGDNPTESP